MSFLKVDCFIFIGLMIELKTIFQGCWAFSGLIVASPFLSLVRKG